MNKSHLTVEVIYKSLEKEIPTISRTSVYNTLNLFHEKDLVTTIFITGLETRFDSNTSPHQHFYCEKCKRIIDLNIKCNYFKKGNTQGHKITELHGYFKGICKDCLKKGENKNE